MNDGPQDPMSALATEAIQVHELFSAYVSAGFSRQESMQLVVSIIALSIGQGEQ
jgi:hypothetical protein